MPRQLTLATAEMGDISLFIIWADEAGWGDWDAVRTSLFAPLLSVIPKTVMDHALRGWTKPLVDALGLPPQGALRKMPPSAKQCEQRHKCIFFEKNRCHPFTKKMPWCYEPDGVGGAPFTADIISHWRKGVYVIVVLEDTDV